MTKRIVLTAAHILGAKDIRTEDVSCPEWAPDGTPEEEKAACVVVIRNLTGEGRGAFIEASMAMKKADENNKRIDFEIEMLLVVMTAVDDEGKALFTREQVKELGQKNADPISRCANVAMRLGGLEKEAKENAAKNSPPAAS